ncbi:hypothetical protein HHI36_013219 [Cryptolaemus montrouzieri]|uniref:Uncharacterized protein n=1 Tax=Cryptolaemus montrouzieri TaxID=559131 RepID=A0ABD2NGH5_9CUCU
MDINREENRRRSMLEEVLDITSDEASSEEKSDHCSEHKLQYDTDQEISNHNIAETNEISANSDYPEDNIPLSVLKTRRHPKLEAQATHYKSKGGQKWYECPL